MLVSLTVNNFLLIESLELNFKDGLTVVTGETGAGKSIILDALLLALGERVSGKIHKDGSKPTTIVAVFRPTPLATAQLHGLGMETQGEIIFRRVIGSDGKSKAYINDINVGVGTLAIFRPYLLEICGQHDSRGLLDATTHIDLLDTFGSYEDKLTELKSIFSTYISIKKELDFLQEKNQKADFETKYLQSMVRELEELAIKQNEEEQLIEERKLLMDGAKAEEAFSKSQEILSDALMARLYTLERELNKFPEIFSEVLGLVKTATIEIQEAKISLNNLDNQIGNNGNQMEKIEERLFKIRAVARKYGILPNLLGELLGQKKVELENYSDLAANLEAKAKELKAVHQKYLDLAKALSDKRSGAAEKLRLTVLEQLADLKLDKADFKIDITNSEYSAKGIDNVKFLVCTNPGTPYGLLDKIASGGELSRIMLALKVAFANVKSVPVLVFDEIDTGISGSVSDAVGKKLSVLGRNYQVMVVTHQPQVAAYGKNHFLVTKQQSKNNTQVSVFDLNLEEKNREIARMLSGDKLTEESVAAAKKLIQTAA